MPDYQNMYFKLFADMAKVMEQLEKILQNGEQGYVEAQYASVKFLENENRASGYDECP